MENIKISFREIFNRISLRDSLNVFARRWRRNDTTEMNAENIEDVDIFADDEREAFKVTDSGRQFELTGSDSVKVRAALAQNPNLHPDVQLALTKDSFIKVRNSLSKNINLSEAVQLKLLKDKFDVRDALMSNPSLTWAVQLKILGKKQSERTIDELSENPNLSLEAIKLILPIANNSQYDSICKRATSLEAQKILYEYAKSEDANDNRRNYWRKYVTEFIRETPLTTEMKEIITRDAVEGKNTSLTTQLLENDEAINEDDLHKIYDNFKNTDNSIVSLVASRTVDPKFQRALSDYRSGLSSNKNLDKSIAMDIIKNIKNSENPELGEDTLKSILQNFRSVTNEAGNEVGQIDSDIASAIIGAGQVSFSLFRNIASRASEEIQKKIIDALALGDIKTDSVGATRLPSYVADAFAENPRASLEAEKFTMKHGDHWAQESIIKSSPHPEFHEMIFNSGDFSLIANLLQNENLAPEYKDRLIDTVDDLDFLSDAVVDGISNENARKIYEKVVRLRAADLQAGKEEDHRHLRICIKLADYTSSVELMTKLAQINEEMVLSNLAGNSKLPKQLQLNLAKTNNDRVQNELAEREDLLLDVQKILSKSAHRDVKAALLDNGMIDTSVIEYLKKIEEIAVRNQITSSKFGPFGRYQDIPMKSVTAEEQKEMLDIGDGLLNLALAANSDQEDVLERVLELKDINIYTALAQNDKCGESIYRKLYALKKDDIDTLLFENDSVPVTIKESFFERYKGTSSERLYQTKLLENGYASREMQLEIWQTTRGKEVSEGSKRRLETVFSKLLSIKNLIPEIQKEIVKYKESFIRLKLASNPSLIEEVQEVLSKDKGSTVRVALALNSCISEKTQIYLLGDGNEKVIMALIQNPSCMNSIQKNLAASRNEEAKLSLLKNPKLSTEAQLILAKDKDKAIRHVLANRNRLPVEVQMVLVKDKDSEVRQTLANGDNLSKEVQFALAKDKHASVRRALEENDGLHPELRVRLRSQPPKGFSKEEYITRVHKNKYIFRILEKYMEDNSLTELAYPKNFKGTPIERYYNQPLVNAMFKENNGKPITIEHVKAAIAKMDGKEFYIFHGDFGSGIQSHEKFDKLPRHSFALLFKDLESDSQTLEFMRDVAPSLAHGDHGSMGGWGEMNMGWILWKDISKMMKSPAVLIEQIQSDWRGLMSKIKAIQDDADNPSSWRAKSMIEEWIEKYGEESLGRIQKNLDELVKDYPEKLMAEFLSNSGVRGKTVYITDKETQRKLVGHEDRQSVMLDVIYDRVPSAFGFHESKELPGFLKLERASTSSIIKSSGYRKYINQKSKKLLMENR